MDENGNVEIGNAESGQGCGNYANGKTVNGNLNIFRNGDVLGCLAVRLSVRITF